MEPNAVVTILGAGPAGLGAALGLARKGHEVHVLEQADRVGGNAGSFELAGVRVDFGSHRFHPAADPEVMTLVRDLLGDDLLERPRHGRIRLMERWIHFPLEPLNLLAHAHPRFTMGVGLDLARKFAGWRQSARSGAATFATVLEAGLGSTICREFYFPYARKIWGLEPDDISPVQATRRVSANSIGKLVKRVLSGGASGSTQSKRVFYYPRQGYGQISERLRTAAEAAGARIHLSSTARQIDLDPANGHRVHVSSASGADVLVSDYVWSTIPATTLVRLVTPGAPDDVVDSASRLGLRSMLLVYLVLGVGRFSEFDAHYFPEETLPFTRVSEPKNYSGVIEPNDRTVLCAEIPCSRQDPLWSKADGDLGALVVEGLERVGLPVPRSVIDIAVRRLPAAYPIYRIGYEEHFERVDRWISQLDRVLSFGRQGLYAHDNTHHALYMAKAAVACMNGRTFDHEGWQRYRKVFETHVVED